jgi:hypothetical protein
MTVILRIKNAVSNPLKLVKLWSRQGVLTLILKQDTRFGELSHLHSNSWNSAEVRAFYFTAADAHSVHTRMGCLQLSWFCS